nr:hypothetical protein [Propionibacterium sp.]
MAESVPWAPLGSAPADAPTVYAPGEAVGPRTPTAPERWQVPSVPPAAPATQPVDPYAQPSPYGQPADPYAQPNPYAPPADPYAHPNPYAPPADPYAQPYAQPSPQALAGAAPPAGGYPVQTGYPAPTYSGPGGPIGPPATPAAPPAPQRPGRPVLPIVAGLLALAVLVVAVLVGQRLLGGPPAPTGTATPTTPVRTTAASPTAPPSTSPVSTVSAAPEDLALAALRQRAAADLPQLSAAVGARAWVAQLASKSVGIEDPLQTAANGTHVFFAVDILAEHDQLKARVRDASVILADSTTYGTRATDTGGRPYWRSIALSPAFTSKEAVSAWCQRTFAPLTGEALANQCVATQL